MHPAVLLIVSNSYDTTADLLVHHLGAPKVFRFNFDLWQDYRFELTPEGFALADPTGRTVGAQDIAKALWRKPWSRREYRPASRTGEERFYDAEVTYFLRELLNLLWLERKVVLVDPFAELHGGKFVQMQVARRHFQVPPFQFRKGFPSRFPQDQEIVVKSLTMQPVGGETADRELLFTTRVPVATLAPDCPWMVQHHVQASLDVTVAFVRDQLFAFQLDRAAFAGLAADWRELPSDWGSMDWRPHALPEDLRAGVFGFMRDMGLHFGRLDFLWGPGGYSFLEVNTNGEWAWLDAEGRHGLLPKMVAEVAPDTPRHPLPPRFA